MNQARPVRFGLPLAVQIIGLLVVVLIIGQLATLAVVVVMPPPRPPVYRIEDLAAAMKGEPAAPRYAPPLVRSMAANPPVERPGEGFRVAALKMQLGRLLGVPEDRIRLVVEPRPRFGFLFGDVRRREPPRDPPPMMEPPGAPSLGPPTPDQAQGAAPRAGDPAADAPWERHGRRRWLDFHGVGGMDRMGVIVGGVEAAYQPQAGPWTIVRSPSEGFPNAWQRRVMLWFLACLLVLTPVGYLFARRLTAPIGRFAAAAERLGRDPRAPAITLRGPAEIGLAAAAFNEMQDRLARYVEDRTAMIAAIAHDLRTPLARVQFKLQRASDEIAADIRTDLSQMDAMIAAVLAFVRDAAPTQERGPLDLLSLLEVVADDAGATGADVSVTPGAALVVDGDAAALQRLFVNLVDNAVKYGGGARIRLFTEAGDAVVEIADDGPGLSEAERERVFEPFYRVETSRSRETGGIGLGLSIARSIARAHGGDVSLTTGGSGLTAVVRLPMAKTGRV